MEERCFGAKSVAIRQQMGRDEDALGFFQALLEFEVFLRLRKTDWATIVFRAHFSCSRPATSGPKKFMNMKLDPLYIIFEKHLYNFQDSSTDRKAFVTNIVQEYLGYLRKMKISIPV